jgi:tripartite ATP-independent transporter DctM subunit
LQVVASPDAAIASLVHPAGYLLVEGGASVRLLRVYMALFGWLPGGLPIATAVACAIFTFAGSGMTIVAMGGLLLPMLVKARYPESFSIGLINASGSLGLLFPPSLPIILYGVYSKTAISTLFVGGLLPGLLMVAMVCAWGVFQGVRHGAVRESFRFPEARRAIWEAKWELALPVIVLVGCSEGWARWWKRARSPWSIRFSWSGSVSEVLTTATTRKLPSMRDRSGRRPADHQRPAINSPTTC